MESKTVKRANEPVVWLLFGAGGTISAIFYPVLVLIVAFLMPFGIIHLENIIIFINTWWGALITFGLIVFPMWCGLHRVHHGLHDLKVHMPFSGFFFYGLGLIFTIVAAFGLFAQFF